MDRRLRTVSSVLAFACVAMGSSRARAEPARAAAESAPFVAAREDHLRRQQAILGYLTGVAAVSLAGGAALLFTNPPGFSDKPSGFRKSFAAFALVYGALNAAFVAANFAGTGRQRTSLSTPSLLDQDRHKQARVFAMNAGLDMIYITLGFTLWATDARPVAQGMGASVALQGGFLLGFDGSGALAMSR